MKIAIIGSSGQLGFDLVQHLKTTSHESLPFTGRAQLDITNLAAVAQMLDSQKPHAVINTAAFHNVDLCEKESDAAFRTNVVAVRDMAIACEARKITFMQIGTDYVVEGAPANKPIPESALVHPTSIYAITRFGGDCATLAHAPTRGYVVRSCGLFGVAGCKLKGGLNFVDTMIAAAKSGKPLKVVDDQIVAPTPTDDLARQLLAMLEKNIPPGIYHAVSHGQCSWYQFAKTALEIWSAKKPNDRKFTIEPVPGSTWNAPAKRPAYSVLDNAKLRALNLDLMQPWQESLARFIHAKYPS